MQAVLRLSQNSPSEVVPSPVLTNTTSSFLNAGVAPVFCMNTPASAQPTAWRNWVPTGEDWLTTFRPLWPQCEGICRPPELGSSFAPTEPISISVGVMPRVSMRARSR